MSRRKDRIALANEMLAPADAPPDSGPAGSPGEHRQRVEDKVQEEAPRDDGEPARCNATPGCNGPVVEHVSPDGLPEMLCDLCKEPLRAARDAVGPAATPAPQPTPDPSCTDCGGTGRILDGPCNCEAPPTAEELTAAVLEADLAVGDAWLAIGQAETEHKMRRAVLARAIDAKARSIGRGALCQIGGTVYRSTPPRKKKGQPEDQAALWGLEAVEVGR